jgi:glyoxylase-like metal-dependent hydrolase (beta-lactamase superfamily II)
MSTDETGQKGNQQPVEPVGENPRGETPWQGCRVWRMYDEQVRAEMSCCATREMSRENWLIIDPLPEVVPEIMRLVRGSPVLTVVLTNANHERGVHLLAETCRIHNQPLRIFAPIQGVQGDYENMQTDWIDLQSEPLPEPFERIALSGFGPGESAVYDPRDSGILHVGDALINLPKYGFTFLPEKYCADLPAGCQALRRLLDKPFERMTFAHGAPIVQQARHRLEQLLETSA